MSVDPRKARRRSALTKSQFIAHLVDEHRQLSETDVELAVNNILKRMVSALANGERIEIRGFGSMTLHYRPPRVGRNPKTGSRVQITGKYVPYFKPGLGLRKQVNEPIDKEDSDS